ncbi:MAG TPA: right-handed parallel beta-helix repeat-containing protein, partial [Kofleriaceae bacterium]|nr:right-handed parallel beta-helix repeat-containing protein [Kofleriaceae bacterium]
MLDGKRHLQGAGPAQTRITNLGTGAVLTAAAMSDVTLDKLSVFGGRNGAEPGNGVLCTGASVLRLIDTTVTQNAADGLACDSELHVAASTFSDNAGVGIRVYGGQTPTYRIERCMVTRNGTGIRAIGAGLIANTFSVRNLGSGLELAADLGIAKVDFSTIANNGGMVRCLLVGQVSPALLSNVIITDEIDNPS